MKAEAKPSAKQIKDIIEKNAVENRKSSDWDNVGFTTDSGITWVDKYRLKDTLTVVNRPEGVFTGLSLYKEVSKNRDRYIIPIHRANRVEAEKTSSGG